VRAKREQINAGFKIFSVFCVRFDQSLTPECVEEVQTAGITSKELLLWLQTFKNQLNCCGSS
jgi:hypothetical protein